MSHHWRYRVVSSFLAVSDPTEGRSFTTVPEGSIVETADDPHQPGLISIQLENRTLMAFTRDILDRAQELTDSQA